MRAVVVGADTIHAIVIKRPREKEVAMPAALAAGFACLVAQQRPYLPASQAVGPSAPVEKRVQVIPRGDVALLGAGVEREHAEANLVAQQSILNRSIKRENGCVVTLGITGTTGKIKREDCSAVLVGTRLVAPPGETEELQQLCARFRACAVVGQQRVQQVELRGIAVYTTPKGKERGKRPAGIIPALLVAKQRAHHLAPQRVRLRDHLKLCIHRPPVRFVHRGASRGDRQQYRQAGCLHPAHASRLSAQSRLN